jgi:hypothetical protein
MKLRESKRIGNLLGVLVAIGRFDEYNSTTPERL